MTTGESQFRLGLPPKILSGRLSDRPENFLLRPENGTFAWDFLGKTFGSHFQPPENCDLVWDVLANHIRALFSNAQRIAISHVISSPRLLQSRLVPPENCDFVWDFLARQIMAPSPATEGGKGHSELQCATFRGSTKWYLVKYRSALFNPAGGYEKYVVESSAARSTP